MMHKVLCIVINIIRPYTQNTHIQMLRKPKYTITITTDLTRQIIKLLDSPWKRSNQILLLYITIPILDIKNSVTRTTELLRLLLPNTMTKTQNISSNQTRYTYISTRRNSRRFRHQNSSKCNVFAISLKHNIITTFEKTLKIQQLGKEGINKQLKNNK